MPNPLTAEAGIKAGPILLETLVKHYFERITKSRQGQGPNSANGKITGNLRQDELLYDEAFTLVKTFLDASTKHTVEELQQFSNARTPSSPSTHVVRLVVPMSCCDAAAIHVIAALGGEEVAKRVVGGTKWWQVRGVKGVAAEWITSKKDWQKHEQQNHNLKRRRTTLNTEDVSFTPKSSKFLISSPKSPTMDMKLQSPPTSPRVHEAWTSDGNGSKNMDADGQRDADEADDSTGNKNRDKHEEGVEAESGGSGAGGVGVGGEEVYEPEMDAMRCILYFHGGGYYFGSVDQERYCIQRFARKINGRVFAPNYRLAPQYPFPCAIQDALASYLYLIRPPPSSTHTPIPPAHIIIAGDSAGGGLVFALLQVIRDGGLGGNEGLPMPGGAVLVSPWCDLTHCFASVHQNMDTDVIPEYGLSLYKPSTLWPPPPEEMTSRVHAGLKSKIRKIAGLEPMLSSASTANLGQPSTSDPLYKPKPKSNPSHVSSSRQHGTGIPQESGISVKADHGTLNLGTITPPPTPLDASSGSARGSGSGSKHEIVLRAADGEVLKIPQQVQLYTTNDLTSHPLVSPALAYLGGLPPMLIIAGDKEVLRDEIIFTAHKAAHPEQYPIKEETRQIYPVLEDIENCYGPTQVHLQVYDETAHVLPVLFPFTTPAKYCYRAIATFCKYATGMLPAPQPPVVRPPATSPTHLRKASGRDHTPARIITSDPVVLTPDSEDESFADLRIAEDVESSGSGDQARHVAPASPRPSMRKRSLSARFSSSLTRASSSIRRSKTVFANGSHLLSQNVSEQNREESTDSGDIAGPRFNDQLTRSMGDGPGTAGDPSAYATRLGVSPFKNNMIRERISTQGLIRSLEPESELPACQMPIDVVGTISELAARRYIRGRTAHDKKFESASKRISKQRNRNLAAEKKRSVRTMSQLQMNFFEDVPPEFEQQRSMKNGIKEGLSAGSWSWAWALDGDERPPPSSIVARRDTEEARRLGKIADQSIMPQENPMSGNNLWQVLVNFLSATPDRGKQKDVEEGTTEAMEKVERDHSVSRHRRGRSKLRRLISLKRSSADGLDYGFVDGNSVATSSAESHG